MKLLTPSLQRYAWGSKSYIQDLISLPHEGVIAEMWLGAHSKAPARIGEHSLEQVIAQNPELWIDPSLMSKTRTLPYLLKVLAADEPLSIQVHPNKTQAEQGFAREEALGIALDDPRRSYKDSNHKPELIMALTPFTALCGIRDFRQIIRIFEAYDIGKYLPAYPRFRASADQDSFRALYTQILSGRLDGIEEQLNQLEPVEDYQDELIWARRLAVKYPGDPFIIAPFIMNLITLSPASAMFLAAGIPHAYLQGAGVEIMAASDNVLRAGLTPKHIDKADLLNIARLEPYTPGIITVPDTQNILHRYPVPVEDFALLSCKLHNEMLLPELNKPAIILCLEGNIRLQKGNEVLDLPKGRAAIIGNEDRQIMAKGSAYFVVAMPG
ncbi:MAG: mannose-6-phosphate isomerase, class I [Candidatus Cloacimonadaceae bacterium]|jgi:mannose-6-phosphate isomerase|nr:mannose-6-phosphate isomerase, class I [Candidatus Cloacimonadaceae bacterium]